MYIFKLNLAYINPLTSFYSIGYGYRITCDSWTSQHLVCDIMMQKQCLLLALAILIVMFALSWINLFHLFYMTANYVKPTSAAGNINVGGDLIYNGNRLTVRLLLINWFYLTTDWIQNPTGHIGLEVMITRPTCVQ